MRLLSTGSTPRQVSKGFVATLTTIKSTMGIVVTGSHSSKDFHWAKNSGKRSKIEHFILIVIMDLLLKSDTTSFYFSYLKTFNLILR